MRESDPLIERLMTFMHLMLGRIKSYRTPLTIVVGAFFLVGLFWSFHAMSINLDQLNYLPAVVSFFVLSPIGIAYGAVGLILLARIAGTRISFGSAWLMAGYAQLAESLPIPGGAIVRTVALKNSGVNTRKSMALVTGSAILWVALSMVGAGIALLHVASFAAAIFLFIGCAIILPIFTWMITQSGLVIAIQMMAHRLVGLFLMCIKMLLAFAIIDIIIPFKTALFFSFANIAGSASAITPAGLGVGEIMAAALAGLVQIPPAAAFLAIALNRIISLTACAFVVMLGSIFKSNSNEIQFTEIPK